MVDCPKKQKSRAEGFQWDKQIFEPASPFKTLKDFNQFTADEIDSYCAIFISVTMRVAPSSIKHDIIFSGSSVKAINTFQNGAFSYHLIGITSLDLKMNVQVVWWRELGGRFALEWEMKTKRTKNHRLHFLIRCMNSKPNRQTDQTQTSWPRVSE